MSELKEKERIAIERLKAFDKMLEAHPNKEYHDNWQNGKDVFNWWLGIDENQMIFEADKNA